MDSPLALAHFARRVLEPGKAERFVTLSGSKKGQRKALDWLCHHFGAASLPATVRTGDHRHVQDEPCFVYHARTGFGVAFDSVREAYASLSVEDSWLIVLADGSAGIHRPEGRWDGEKLLVAN